MRLLLGLLSGGWLLAAAVALCFYGYIHWELSTPPTYWETIAGRYYRDLTWAFFLAFSASVTVLAFRVTYQLAAERPPMNDSGYWRLKAILLSLVVLFLAETAGVTVKSLDAYYAYYDAAYPAFGEGKYLKGMESGDSVEIRLEINDQIVAFSSPAGGEWKSFQWKDPVVFQYGEKTRTLGHIEALAAPAANLSPAPPSATPSGNGASAPATASPAAGGSKGTGSTSKAAPAAKGQAQGVSSQSPGGTSR
ncbi:hypothetical protein GTO91_02050 [Heliobacterium undosum]|uniref:Uncharacterized protein n=1 Tax=Heliomicrobium undosum TaxID=121734 RepID=A0A845KXU4_9FIRM|nr:hypothetical protein [Heliomicrobium undosum]MZP28507.1 hypothetical protein [Heliomicrobium undosum]